MAFSRSLNARCRTKGQYLVARPGRQLDQRWRPLPGVDRPEGDSEDMFESAGYLLGRGQGINSCVAGCFGVNGRVEVGQHLVDDGTDGVLVTVDQVGND